VIGTVKESSDLFENEPAVTFALDRHLRIVYCNKAWDHFAEANSAMGLKRPAAYGCSVLDVVPESLKDLYRSAYLNVFAYKRQWVFHYECSSAAVFRLFRMVVRHWPHSNDFIVIANSLLEERPHRSERPGDAA
jgi:hypothetical protein